MPMAYEFTSLVYSANIGEILSNFGKAIQKWGEPFLMLLGLALIAYEGYKLVRYFFGNGQAAQQYSLVKIICGLLVGGMFAFTGAWKTWEGLAKDTKDTINDAAKGGASIVIDPSISIVE